MKKLFTMLATAAVCSSLAPAETASSNQQLQVYPKNLAHQHLGSNLFIFNSSTQTYTGTEAASAWLDDDASTGAALLPGKQNYLLAFTEPEMLTNFSISTRATNGTVTLYSGDEPAVPGAKTWMQIAKDLPLESVNQKKLGKPFSRLAKYLLIQTDVPDPGQIFGVYVYGEKPAVSYSLQKRVQPIDAAAIYGKYLAAQTNFNLSGLYAGTRVAYANSDAGYLSWQSAIDDNPESGLTIAPSTNESGVVMAYPETRTVTRLSVLTDPGAKGELQVFAIKDSAPASETKRAAIALDGLTPLSLVLDGTNNRVSMDIPPIEASRIALRWVPANYSDRLTIREFGSYGNYTLNDYEVSPSPEAVAEYRARNGGDHSKDGKDLIDPKKNPEPVALGPSSPYLPGALGFPPNIRTRAFLPPTPQTPPP